MTAKKYKNELIRQAHDWMVMAIYEAAKIENISFTFPETEEIVKNEYKVASKYKNNSYGLDVIINLKKAYKAALDLANLNNYQFDYKDFLYIHRIVGEGIVHNNGSFRTDQVAIRGSSYKPPFPPTPEIWKEQINNVLKTRWTIDDILNLYVNAMKQQYFNDGNKRASLVFINTLLMSKELGFINIKDTQTKDFFVKLIDYYENKISKEQFINFIKNQYLIHSFDPTYHKNGIKINKPENITKYIKNKKEH